MSHYPRVTGIGNQLSFPLEHDEPGLRADKAKPNLLKGATTKTLSPYIGTEIHGVQVSKLSKEGLDELALLTAERKVVVFRDQDFKDLSPERQIEIANHFGPIQRHPTSGNVKGFPEFHVGESAVQVLLPVAEVVQSIGTTRSIVAAGTTPKTVSSRSVTSDGIAMCRTRNSLLAPLSSGIWTSQKTEETPNSPRKSRRTTGSRQSSRNDLKGYGRYTAPSRKPSILKPGMGQ